MVRHKQTTPKHAKERVPTGAVPLKAPAYRAARKTPATQYRGPEPTSHFRRHIVTALVDCVTCMVSRPCKRGLETLIATSDGLLLRLPEPPEPTRARHNLDMCQALELLGTDGTPYVVQPGGFIAATWDAFSESVLLLEGGKSEDEEDYLRLVQLKEVEDGRNTVSLVTSVWGKGRREVRASKPTPREHSSGRRSVDSKDWQGYDSEVGELSEYEGSEDWDEDDVASVDSRADYDAAVVNSLLASDGTGRVFWTSGPAIDCTWLPAHMRAGGSGDCVAAAGVESGGELVRVEKFWKVATPLRSHICGLAFMPGGSGGGGSSSGGAAPCLVAATQTAVFRVELPNEAEVEAAAAKMAAAGDTGYCCAVRQPMELLAGDEVEAGNGSANDDDGTGGPSGRARFMRITGLVAAEDSDGAPILLVLEQRSFELTAVRKIRGWQWSAAEGGVKAPAGAFGDDDEDEDSDYWCSDEEGSQGEDESEGDEEGAEEGEEFGGERKHRNRKDSGEESRQGSGMPTGTVRVSTLEQVYDLQGSPVVLPCGCLAYVPREGHMDTVELLRLGVRPLQPQLQPPCARLQQPCGHVSSPPDLGLVQLGGCCLVVRRGLLAQRFSNLQRFRTNKTGPAWDIPRYDLSTCDPKLLLQLLRWVYTGTKVEVPPERVQALAEVAGRLGAAELVEQVCRRVMARVDVSTVVDTLVWAESRGPAFRGLQAQLKSWYLAHQEEVMERAEHSVRWLMTSRPKLALELWRSTLRVRLEAG
eukprot:XP_001690362.1 predicted protein [Chlamydomonas reinhardtii]